jgi:hypothetical protein
MNIRSLTAGVLAATAAAAAVFGGVAAGAASRSASHPIVAELASEKIPHAARVLDVEVQRHGRVLRSTEIDNARAVRKIASTIDRLPARRRHAVVCDFLTDGTRYVLTFRASPSGPPLAEAAQLLPVIRGCTFMQLNIGGRRQTPLERGGVVLGKLK